MSRAEEIARGVAALLEDARIDAAPETPSKRTVAGRRNGVHVSVTVWYSTSNRAPTSGWAVKTKARGPALLAMVRPRSFGEAHAIASGAIQAVATGDEAFDRSWLVEGAPEEVLRDFVDASVREAITNTSANAKDCVVDVDNGIVKVSGDLPRPHDSEQCPAAIERAIDAALAVRGRLTALPPLDDDARRAAEAAIAALREKREHLFARASWPNKILLMVLGVVLVVGLGAGLVYGCLPSM